jgi:hypothetical protein
MLRMCVYMHSRFVENHPIRILEDRPLISEGVLSQTLLLYVDDMIITGDDHEYIAFVKAHLSDRFLMSDLGPLRYFLQIEISSTSEGLFLSQEKYI